MNRADAERAARLELGSAAAVKDWTRDVGWESRVESVWQDVRYAARVLLRNPAFSIFAVVTLALGIGASTAVFSVAYGVALRPLPYPDPERLVRLYEARPADGELEHEVSVGAFHAWREGGRSIESAALFSRSRTRFLAGTEGGPLAVRRVSPSFFNVLRVGPMIGPGFKPESEYTRYTAEDEAVLAFGAWQRLFQGRPDVIGQSLELAGVGDNDLIRIVGVMPDGFTFGEPVDLWVPSLTVERADSRLMRQWRYDHAIARLRPGASIEAARSELSAISARLAEAHPDTNSGWTIRVKPLHEAVIGNFGAKDMAAAGRRLTAGLRSGSSGAGELPARQTVRFALILMQCAGAAALVILTMMFARSFHKLTVVDLGWDPAGVLSLRVSPPMPPELRRPWARYVDWSDRLIARLEALPDIERAAITTQIPLSPDTYPAAVAPGRGRKDGQQESWPAVQHSVSDGYFDAMRIRLVSGRGFGAGDRFTAAQLIDSEVRPPFGSAIVTESTARALWPEQDPVGRTLWLPNIDTVEWREVVGVVEDIDFHAVAEEGVRHVFVPWTQFPTGSPRLVVRGTSAAAALAPGVRAVLQEVEAGTRVDQVVALQALTARATAQPRFTSRVVALFGVLALVLAAVGVHGTLAYIVRARTREIGIRLALGASRGDLLRRTLMSAFVPVLIGGVTGTAVAIAVARASNALLFDVTPLDAGSIVAGAVVLLGVALAAAAGPARRAARVDPIIALRAE